MMYPRVQGENHLQKEGAGGDLGPQEGRSLGRALLAGAGCGQGPGCGQGATAPKEVRACAKNAPPLYDVCDKSYEIVGFRYMY